MVLNLFSLIIIGDFKVFVFIVEVIVVVLILIMIDVWIFVIIIGVVNGNFICYKICLVFIFILVVILWIFWEIDLIFVIVFCKIGNKL